MRFDDETPAEHLRNALMMLSGITRPTPFPGYPEVMAVSVEYGDLLALERRIQQALAKIDGGAR